MLNKVTVAVSAIVVLLLVFFVYQKYFVINNVHYHAGFRVFVDGTLQDFSGPEYMSLKPCMNKSTDGNEQDEKGHLHDRIGYVVHVHRSGAKWSDLFANIHFPIPKNKEVIAYINGQPKYDFPDIPIRPYDTLVLIIGKHGDIPGYLEQAVTKKMIQDVEKKSELCGSNTK